MKNISGILATCFAGLFCICHPAYSWSDNTTHPAVTKKAVQLSTMDNYLKNQLGIQQGLAAEFQIVLYPALQERMAELDPEITTRSALDWLKTGSQLEDKILITQYRPRHHFHDPNRNAGLDNKTDHSEWREYGPAYWSNYKFDFTGESALDWAIYGSSDKIPSTNLETWDLARRRFYNAVTYTTKSDRDKNMAMAMLSLGSVTHLLEDMGVPAHTRNDFLFGHYRNWLTGFVFRWGNDLEDYVEGRVISNGGQSPWSGSTPVAFDKLAKYFDADVYFGGYLGNGILPPNTWGLSECSNYQFLSTSTMFGCSGTKYQFPHPDKENTPPNMLVSVPDGYKVYFNGSNYGVPHIARESYTHYVATGWDCTSSVIDRTNTTDDVGVSEDYANITIPRTINYATGLINYFFRGKLNAEKSGCVNGKIEITITNKSTNSSVNQTIKGGTFSLYWDDSSGNRTQVSDFTVYRPGTQPVAGNEWNSSTQMNYDQSTKAALTPPESEDIQQYILVYEGIISATPGSPDLDDTKQIATAVFTISSAPCDPDPCPSCIPQLWMESPDYIKVSFSGLSGGNGCPIAVDLDLVNRHPFILGRETLGTCGENNCQWIACGDGWDMILRINANSSHLWAEISCGSGYWADFFLADAIGCLGQVYPQSWSSTINYNLGSVVEYCGETYISKANNNLNHLPTDIIWWTEIIAKGFNNELGYGGTAVITWEGITENDFWNQWWPVLAICGNDQ